MEKKQPLDYNRVNMLPELFRIFSVSVSGYMFFYILGLVIGSLVILRLARREKLDTIEITAYLFLGIASLVLGSRLLGAVFGQIARLGKQPLSFPALLEDFRTGGSFFGGAAAFLIFIIFYSRVFFKNERRCLWDITAIGVALGHAIGRLGCFCAGCCYGIPTSVPWGVPFTWLGHAPHHLAGIPLHPVQLYEAALCFANFIFLLLLWRKRCFPGQIFSFYLINYGLIRFFLEFLRHHGPGDSVWTGGLSWYQVLSLLLILAGWLGRIGFKKI